MRQAEPRDLEWISDHYLALDFLPSDISTTPIAIAEVSGEKIGLGRLTPLEDSSENKPGSCELGGLWVAHAYRDKNTAERLIEYLIGRAAEKSVYMIPFKGALSDFLATLSFTEIEINQSELAPKLMAKINFCKSQYTDEICLMRYLPAQAGLAFNEARQALSTS